MKTRYPLRFCFTALLLAGLTARADTAVTPPAGYYKLTAKGRSDSLLSVPLLPRAALLARVAATSATTLTLAAARPFVDGAYAPTSGLIYTVQFMSGPLEGVSYKVTGNSGGIFVLDTLGDDLTHHTLGAVAASVTSGDLVHIRACWTVGEIFGRTLNELVLTTVPELDGPVYTSGDLLLLPNNTTASLDKKPALEIGYVSSQGWRQRGGASADASAQPLPAGVPLTVRRQDNAPVSIWVVGYVPQERGVIRLPSVVAGGENDFAVSLLHPLTRTVSALQLGAAIIPSQDVLHYGDGVLDFTSNRRGFALPPEHRLYYTTSGWREGDMLADNYTLTPDAGYILRLRGTHPVSYWLQSLPYSR
jgi:uncharacterized protein (TIGR02597 family)